ncbi:MAG: radical SAM protein [Syntrophobacteraceae bacterium]|nr:radical SAM protein [Syntrophobacteraceae bacterium]
MRVASPSPTHRLQGSASTGTHTIFGPVPSRRLGRSLGIDVIPPKTCSFDCIYCESGRTTLLTMERQLFLPPESVFEDLRRHCADHPGAADILTLSSAGEPTLYAALGDLLAMIKHGFPDLPLAVITNGSLLWDPSVRHDLKHADLVIPSLDAVTPAIFERINRPCEGVTMDLVLEGLHAFRREYRGRLHMEILLVAGHNDLPTEIRKLARVMETIRPDAVELNTVVRPPALPGVAGLSETEMERARSLFAGSNTTIVGSYHGKKTCLGEDRQLESRILALVGRRPCTALEMAHSLSVPSGQMEQAVEDLVKAHSIEAYAHAGSVYFRIARKGHQRHHES